VVGAQSWGFVGVGFLALGPYFSSKRWSRGSAGVALTTIFLILIYNTAINHGVLKPLPQVPGQKGSSYKVRSATRGWCDIFSPWLMVAFVVIGQLW
jgi:hypothetical protein